MHGGPPYQRRSPDRLLLRGLGPAGVADDWRGCAGLPKGALGSTAASNLKPDAPGPGDSTVQPQAGEGTGEVQPIT